MNKIVHCFAFTDIGNILKMYNFRCLKHGTINDAKVGSQKQRALFLTLPTYPLLIHHYSTTGQ